MFRALEGFIEQFDQLVLLIGLNKLMNFDVVVAADQEDVMLNELR